MRITWPIVVIILGALLTINAVLIFAPDAPSAIAPLLNAVALAFVGLFARDTNKVNQDLNTQIQEQTKLNQTLTNTVVQLTDVARTAATKTVQQAAEVHAVADQIKQATEGKPDETQPA